jgi:hypothetical protein
MEEVAVVEEGERERDEEGEEVVMEVEEEGVEEGDGEVGGG